MKDQLNKIDNFYTPQSATKLVSASISREGLVAEFVNGLGNKLEPKPYSWRWVRDHCIDPQSLDQGTTQRKVNTFDLAPDLICTGLAFAQPEQLVHLSWDDGTSSSISAYVLAAVVGYTPGLHELIPQIPQVIWDKDSPLLELPRVEFEDVIQSDKGLLQWLENIHVYGFSLVDGVPATEQGTTQLALRLGKVQETIFGGMWPLSSELTDHGDSAYSNSYLEPHTDGTYYHDAPGLQMFNCLDIDCEGGQSIQLDGFAIAQRIKREDPEAYQTLSDIIVPGHYLEDDVHLHAERPTIRMDASGKLVQVSFNNYDRAPMLLAADMQERFYHAYSLFHSHVIDQDNWLRIEMKPGTTLIFDNWRNMHGRVAYRGSRYFYGCYHSKAVFESKLRVLQASVK